MEQLASNKGDVITNPALEMQDRENKNKESPVLIVDRNVFSSIALTGMFNQY